MILVTGGAGFVGSHLVDALLNKGHRVRVLDAFVEQVHGAQPRALPCEVDVVRGDVRDRSVVDRALRGVDVVFHLAAEVGVGQSMYEIERYVSANCLGTATLLEAVVRRRREIRKLVVASSMSIYGEGSYRCAECGPREPEPRDEAQLKDRAWEVRCDRCGVALEPMLTPETKALNPASVYAITKQDEEQYCLVVGKAYSIPTVALRYFNVYGRRQALSNPYTGVMAIFCGRLLNKQPPLIFEDGLQSRDFTHVSDVVRANLRAMESARADFHSINVGTGVATSVKRVAQLLGKEMNTEIQPTIVGRYRAGDIRHCVGDITRARNLLGFEPEVSVENGIPELLRWVVEQRAVDTVDKATQELVTRGLVR